MASVDLLAGTIEYVERGPADGRPVVFVHGFIVDGSLWTGVAERLAARGLRTIVPTWPLGAHRVPMAADADLSPRGVAGIVTALLAALDLEDVVLVGNDTGGGICQLLLDAGEPRVGALVLTNCDAFDTFPPKPFDLLFRLGRHPRALRAGLLPTRLGRVRTSALGFGLLAARRLTGPETRSWTAAYLDDAGVRRDTAAFCRAWRPDALADLALAGFDRPVLLVWGAADRFFRVALARRLAATFTDARLVELPGARTFVSLDDPDRLAEEIGSFVGARTPSEGQRGSSDAGATGASGS